MRMSGEQQLALLRKSPYWTCSAREGGPGSGIAVDCTPTEPQRAYGARIRTLEILRVMGGDQAELRLSLEGDDAELRALASRVWQRSFNANNIMPLSDDGANLSFVRIDATGEVSMVCALALESRATLRLPNEWQTIVGGAGASDSRAFESDLDPYEGVAKLEGAALKQALPTCGADYWLANDFDTRIAELKTIGIACKTTAHDSGRQAECTLPAGTQSFGGYAVEKMEVFDEGGVHEANFTARAAPNALAAAMRKDTQTDLDDFGNSAGMYVNQIDDRFRYIVWPHESDPQRSVLNCRMNDITASDTDPAVTAGDEHDIPPGSIAGTIRYPSEDIPAMRICATYRGGMMHGCTQTKPGQNTYRIDYLAPAEAYMVMASIEQGEWPIGGHAQPIRCIQAPCPDSTLIPVEIKPGQGIQGIDINEFVTDADSWPPMPVEDDH